MDTETADSVKMFAYGTSNTSTNERCILSAEIHIFHFWLGSAESCYVTVNVDTSKPSKGKSRAELNWMSVTNSVDWLCSQAVQSHKPCKQNYSTEIHAHNCYQHITLWLLRIHKNMTWHRKFTSMKNRLYILFTIWSIGEIPSPNNEVGTQKRNQWLVTQDLRTENICKDTLVVMQVDC